MAREGHSKLFSGSSATFPMNTDRNQASDRLNLIPEDDKDFEEEFSIPDDDDDVV